MISRRGFVVGSGAVFAAPLAAEGQPARVYRVGVLLGAPVSAVEASVQTFREGLRDLGYVEGQNLALELRWMTTAESRLDRLAADLVRSKTDVLVTWATPATLAAKRATSTVPIVMVSIGDPVGAGLVASLSRPGGNVTGVSNVSLDLTGKQLQLLTELRPGVTRIAVLWDGNPTPTAELFRREVETAARLLGVQLQFVVARDRHELEAAFAALGRERPSGLLVFGHPLFLTERSRIAELAQKVRLPTAFGRRENVEAGGRTVPAGRHVRGQDPERRQPRRPSSRAAHEVRAGDQRPHHPPSLPLRADQVIE